MSEGRTEQAGSVVWDPSCKQLHILGPPLLSSTSPPCPSPVLLARSTLRARAGPTSSMKVRAACGRAEWNKLGGKRGYEFQNPFSPHTAPTPVGLVLRSRRAPSRALPRLGRRCRFLVQERRKGRGRWMGRVGGGASHALPRPDRHCRPSGIKRGEGRASK